MESLSDSRNRIWRNIIRPSQEPDRFSASLSVADLGNLVGAEFRFPPHFYPGTFGPFSSFTGSYLVLRLWKQSRCFANCAMNRKRQLGTRYLSRAVYTFDPYAKYKMVLIRGTQIAIQTWFAAAPDGATRRCRVVLANAWCAYARRGPGAITATFLTHFLFAFFFSTPNSLQILFAILEARLPTGSRTTRLGAF